MLANIFLWLSGWLVGVACGAALIVLSRIRWRKGDAMLRRQIDVLGNQILEAQKRSDDAIALLKHVDGR